MTNKVIITLTGPSASGKTTLEKLLCGPPGSIFKRVVSTTTRLPRVGEIESGAYHFVSKAEFEDMIERGELMEHVTFGDNHYGATKTEFESIFAEGKIPVLVCEPSGRSQVEARAFRLGWTPLMVFITNPAKVRYQRLVDRFIGDLSGPATETQKVRDAFVGRLTLVGDVESTWEDDAWMYDIVIDAFNEKNQTAVVNMITAEALNRLATA